MKKIEINCSFREYDDPSELSEEDRKLLGEARASVPGAYAPYSGFHVGAALLLQNGKIIHGNNQENASYPVGLCAERVALFSAGANFPAQPVKAIAITAESRDFSVIMPVPPCGACRQALSEYERRHNSPIRIIMSGASGKILVTEGTENLLPFQFNSDDLKKK